MFFMFFCLFMHRKALEGGGGDDRNGDRSGSRAEVRARTLMGKTVLAVLRKLNLGQVSGEGVEC